MYRGVGCIRASVKERNQALFSRYPWIVCRGGGTESRVSRNEHLAREGPKRFN